MSPRPRLSTSWIKDSDWPESVKQQAILVIKFRAELTSIQQKFNKVNMMHPDKILLGGQLSSVLFKLATAYSNLSKELAYHLATSTSLNKVPSVKLPPEQH